MSNNELLTVQQFADAAGVSKQAIYKAMNGKLQPYVQLVDKQKLLPRKALIEFYGKKVEQLHTSSQPQGNSALDAMIAVLKDELKAKNEQLAQKDQQIKELTDLLAAKDRQIENLTSSIDNVTTSLQAAQALHGGTMKQLVAPEEAAAPADVVIEAEPEQKKRGFFSLFKKNKE
jgi:chromosome segregation ATPase